MALWRQRRGQRGQVLWIYRVCAERWRVHERDGLTTGRKNSPQRQSESVQPVSQYAVWWDGGLVTGCQIMGGMWRWHFNSRIRGHFSISPYLPTTTTFIITCMYIDVRFIYLYTFTLMPYMYVISPCVLSPKMADALFVRCVHVLCSWHRIGSWPNLTSVQSSSDAKGSWCDWRDILLLPNSILEMRKELLLLAAGVGCAGGYRTSSCCLSLRPFSSSSSS